jgi:hypothetical protein
MQILRTEERAQIETVTPTLIVWTGTASEWNQCFSRERLRLASLKFNERTINACITFIYVDRNKITL